MRKFLALVLALVMTMSLVTVSAGAATSFTDDASITNTEAVEVMNAIGILGGYADGSFRPNATLTRGAGAKMVAYLMLGQEKADNLKATYTVFSDVDDTVVLAPYIEWAYANGLVQGYGDGTFGPYNTLTEYAFGKMLLTAIGYDSAKQGYVGNGWQKAVYRDALASDIYDGTEAFGACTRDTAARLCLATLETSYVVYGEQEVFGRYEINGVWYDILDTVITVNGVADTDLPVWRTYPDLEFDGNDFDVWGNPGDSWTYEDEEIGFYEDEYVVSYTEQVDYCDLLVDLGIPVSSDKAASLWFTFNGDIDVDDADYYEVIEHEEKHYHCDEAFIGGQGVLTKVFEIEGETRAFWVTEVATYLAEVTDVTKTHKGVTASLDIYDHNLVGFGQDKLERDLHDDNEFDAEVNDDLTIDTDAYEEGDYVLVTVANGEVQTHELATPKAAKLTGAKTAAQASPAVGTTNKTADAFGFVLGYDEVKAPANWNGNYNFYFDTYGNVIGAKQVEDITVYTVIDAIWHNHNDGEYVVKADLVSLTAEFTKGALVDELDGDVAADLSEDDAITEDKTDDLLNVTETLYTYNINSDGEYDLDEVDVGEGVDEKVMVDFAIDFADGDDRLTYYDGSDDQEIVLNNKTQILILTAGGDYEAVTGYKNLKALTAERAEVIYNTYMDGEEEKVGDEAAIVLLIDVIYAGDSVLGYVASPEITEIVTIDDDMYYAYEVYVDGVAREIYVNGDDAEIIDNGEEGLYEFTFVLDDGELVVDTVEKQDDSGDTSVFFVTDLEIDYNGTDPENKCSFTDGYTNLKLDDVKIYVVDLGDDTVTVGDYTELENDLGAELVFDEDGEELLAIYVLWTESDRA